MAYQLGIDLGTTYTAAAVHRDGKVEVVTLGNRAASIPSVIFLKEDEAVLTGDAASRRGLSEPDRLAREFKRRVGDPTPLLLGATPYSAEALMAKLLRWTFDAVSELQGGPPERIAITHPANWGPFKKDLLDQAVRMADLQGVTTLTEPEAAAIYYASNERVPPGSVIAVYDLGGGTFDAAVLRKGDQRWEILGTPEGIERLGGIDFDEAVFSHVRRSLQEQFDALDPGDPTAIDAVARVRQDAVEAKEALSSDTDVSIPVLLPNASTQVRLTRAEFEAMIRPTLQETIGALQRALRSAGVEPAVVSAVLLVGGSSRIPLVTQLVSAEFGRPVAVDAHPKHAIALGAALAAASAQAAPTEAGLVEIDAGNEADKPAEGAEPAPSEPAPSEPAPSEPAAASPPPPPAPPTPATPAPPDATAEHPPPTQEAPVAAAPPATPPPVAPGPPPGGSDDDGPVTHEPPERRLPIGLVIGGIAALVVVIGLAVVLLGGGGDDDPGDQVAATDDTADVTEDTSADEDEGTGTTAGAGNEAGADPEGPAARVADVTVEDDRYVIEYESFGFTPQVNNPGAFHVHFFWDTLPVINAGTNGPDPGQWLLWDTPFTVSDAFFDVGAKPEGARKICVVVTNNAHEIADVDNDGATDIDTGNCFDLPQS